MATGTIIGSPVVAGQYVYVSVMVAEGGLLGNVEYIGKVPMVDDLGAFGFAGQTWAQLSNANKKAALIAAVKAARDGQQATAQTIAGISGSVTL